MILRVLAGGGGFEPPTFGHERKTHIFRPLATPAPSPCFQRCKQGREGGFLAQLVRLRCLPGAIVLGLDAKIEQYMHLPNGQQRLLTALRLANVCVAPESVAVVGLSPGAESVPPREGGRERRPGHGPSVRFQWAYRTSACNAYISNETEYMAHVLGFAVHYGDRRS
jgi:hypothetical protein